MRRAKRWSTGPTRTDSVSVLVREVENGVPQPGLSTGVCADFPQIRCENSAFAKNDRVIEKMPRRDKFGHSWHQQKGVGEDRDNFRRAVRRCPDLA
jgi:hypothetical protein